MSMTTNNLSLSGAQIACPAMIYRLISRHLDSPRVPIALDLDDDTTIEIDGRVAYASDYDDEFLLGVAFEAIADDGQEKLRDYLVTHGGPAYAELEM